MTIIDKIKTAFKKNKTVETSNNIEKASSLESKIKEIGFKLGNIDYETVEDELSRICKYNPTLGASIRAINRNVITPELKIWNKKTEKEVELAELTALLNKPNFLQNYNSFLKFNVYQKLIDGNTYIRKIKSGNRIIGLFPLKYELVKPKLKNGQIIYEYRNGNLTEYISAEEIMHWKDNDYGNDYLIGCSPVKHLLYSVINSNYADRFNKATLENGGEIKGLLKTEQRLSEADIDMYQAVFKKRHGGTEKAGSTAILGQGLDYVQTGQSIKDLGYQNLKKITREEVLSIFKVPPIEIGYTNESNYANSNIQYKMFWNNTMIPLLDDYALLLTEELLRKENNIIDLEFYYDYSGVGALKEDLTIQLQNAQLALYLGIKLEAIVRELEIPFDENDIDESHNVNNSTQEENKHIKKELDMKEEAYEQHLKTIWIKEQKFSERTFYRAITKYFLDIRNKILDALTELEKNEEKALDNNGYDSLIRLLEDEENVKMLEKLALTNLTTMTDRQVKNYLKKFDILYERTYIQNVIIANHAVKISQVAETTISQVQEILTTAQVEGWRIADIANEIKADYKTFSRNRAWTIARTEMTSVSNDLILKQLEIEGYTKKRWLTADDNIVRESHKQLNRKVTELAMTFDNGLLYPGDMTQGEAAEVVNCRCTLIPVN